MVINTKQALLPGHTPLLRLEALERRYRCRGRLYAKCEFMNPTGSVKDRTALGMITAALEDGRLDESGTVIWLSVSGSGVSAAFICARLGLKCIVVASDSISLYDLRRIKAYGATLFMIPASLRLAGVKERCGQLAENAEKPCIFDLLTDQNNPLTHRKYTGPEILEQLPDIDALVCGIGTGGTVTGCGEYIKMHRPDCLVAGVEPWDSPVLSGGLPGPHSISGIGLGIAPEVLNDYILDKVIRVKTPDCYEAVSALASREGLLCGPSSGAALAAAIFMAQQEEWQDKNILAVLPDRGEQYLDRSAFSV